MTDFFKRVDPTPEPPYDNTLKWWERILIILAIVIAIVMAAFFLYLVVVFFSQKKKKNSKKLEQNDEYLTDGVNSEKKNIGGGENSEKQYKSDMEC